MIIGKVSLLAADFAIHHKGPLIPHSWLSLEPPKTNNKHIYLSLDNYTGSTGHIKYTYHRNPLLCHRLFYDNILTPWPYRCYFLGEYSHYPSTGTCYG